MDKKSFPIWSLLYRNVILIIVVAVIFGTLFGVFEVITRKPSYTASKVVVVSADIDPDSVKTSAYATNNVTLANLLLPTIVKNIKTQKVVGLMNDGYQKESVFAKNENQNINGKSIEVSYKEDSLFFTVSYTDVSSNYAKEKLDYVINSLNTIFTDLEEMDSKILSTGHISVFPVQNTANVTANDSLLEKTVLGICVGLLLSICFVFIRYALDYKITS